MSVFQKWSTGLDNRDADVLATCLHDDYTFVRHQSGTTMNKRETVEMLRSFLGNESVVQESRRCLYENEDVLVEHIVMSFAVGTKESVIGFNRLQDGLIIQTETGATPIKD